MNDHAGCFLHGGAPHPTCTKCAVAERDGLRARVEQLEAALRFYAEQYGLGARLASDGGKIARAALSGLGDAG